MDAPPPSLDALRIDRSKTPLHPEKSRPWWLIILVLLLLAGTAFWWFRGGRGISVKTATVTLQTTASNRGARTLLNASGYVTTRLEATVSSKITGKVAEILVEEGMKVEKNQVLARLDDSNVQSSLNLAKAQLASANLILAEIEPMVKFAESELARLNTLDSPRSVSRSEVAKAESEALSQAAKLARQKADVIVAERQMNEWEQQLDDTIIRAPFAGVVTTKDSQPGEMISPMSSGGFTRTGICTLVDMNSLEIEVDVGESFINRVKPNQPVEATLDAYSDWKIPGKVIAIIPTADRQKATVKVRVGFEKLDPRILPQMGVKVAFQSDEPAATTTPTRALTIPKNATRKSNGRDIAWVVTDGKVERRAITLANSNAAEITVTAGLSLDEVVVLDPPATLADGIAVSVETPR
jgi:RND family efflux transporter MFP subunit